MGKFMDLLGGMLAAALAPKPPPDMDPPRLVPYWKIADEIKGSDGGFIVTDEMMVDAAVDISNVLSQTQARRIGKSAFITDAGGRISANDLAKALAQMAKAANGVTLSTDNLARALNRAPIPTDKDKSWLFEEPALSKEKKIDHAAEIIAELKEAGGADLTGYEGFFVDYHDGTIEMPRPAGVPKRSVAGKNVPEPPMVPGKLQIADDAGNWHDIGSIRQISIGSSVDTIDVMDMQGRILRAPAQNRGYEIMVTVSGDPKMSNFVLNRFSRQDICPVSVWTGDEQIYGKMIITSVNSDVDPMRAEMEIGLQSTEALTSIRFWPSNHWPAMV